MSLNVVDIIRQAISNANFDYSKVICDVAEGFKLSGFFDKPNWKSSLETCFERKRLGLTNEEIQIYASVLSDSSYEAAFVNGLTAGSTPFATRPIQKENTALRSKRSSTLYNDESPLPDMRKKFKKTTNSPDDIKVAKILVELKDANWTEILPKVNAKQKAAKFVNNFEKSKQLKQARTSIQNLPSHVNKCISKRRNAIYIPPAQQPIDTVPVAARVSVPVAAPASSPVVAPAPSPVVAPAPYPVVAPASSPVVAPAPYPVVAPVVSKTPQSANTKRSSVRAKPKDPEDNVVLTNITNRRTTRRQTQLLAAFSGSSSNNITERRNTKFFQRTSVLFTMIDILPYKDVLHTFNIFVADINEKYDYVIAERICRSPKFLSAVVAGKPIVSLDWLKALKNSKDWLDPLNFLLKDNQGEKFYNFNLSNTLALATNRKIFANYSILVTPNTKTGPELLKDVIFSGGGKFLKTTLVPRKGDEVICVSVEADKKMWPRLKKKYPTLKKIISLEGFSKMIFQYTCEVSQADVLH